MPEITSIVISLVIVLLSAVVHEVMHGVVAEKFGDNTARMAGRITLNPIRHIDLFGSILLPFLMLWSTGGKFALGSAKPVPVNFDNMRNPRLGMVMVSLAGPFSNFALAILLSLPVKFGLLPMNDLLGMAILINIILGIFNLIPIPPLDGSKVLAAFLPYRYLEGLMRFEQYGFIVILFLLMTGTLSRIMLPILALFVYIFRIPL